MKRGITYILLISLAIAASAQEGKDLQWDWHKVQDASEPLEKVGGLSPRDRQQLARNLAEEFSGEPNATALAKRTRVKLIDLNRDGIPEVIAQGSGERVCGATGNCPFWIYQKQGGTYKLLLYGTAQTFTIQPTRTNGFSDLVLGIHDSATRQDLLLYQFHRREYRQTGCYVADWSYLASDGERHDLKQPNITDCQSYDQELSSCAASIPDMAPDANLIVTVRVKSVGPMPGSGMGSLPGKQGVTYLVDSVLKGTWNTNELSVDYPVKAGSRISDGKELDSELFRPGNRLIVFLRVYGTSTTATVDTLADDCSVLADSTENRAAVQRVLNVGRQDE